LARLAVTPADLRWPDLVWSHFSRPRFDDFDARLRAAAAAGFAGVGLYAPAFERMRDDGRAATDIAAAVAAHGLVLAEVETVRGWWAAHGPQADECRTIEELAYELADAAGVRYLQAIGPYECSVDQAAHGFAGLCDRAAEHGLNVGIEWLPYTNITSAADARRIVEAADRPNGGYCVDIWHHVRGANDVDLLRQLPAEKIFAVQMNDGPALPQIDDYKADCLATRVPPGDGSFDCAGFIETMIEIGVTAPISLEVCSTKLWAASAHHAAKVAADGMRRVLAQVTEQ
jgi:sugar phosphate isomerase/epimerase